MRRPAGIGRMAKVFMLVLAIGLVPLAIGAIAIARNASGDHRRTLDHALAADAHSGTADLESYFDRARSIALLTAENPVFSDFYAHHAKSVRGGRDFERVNRALAYLQQLYPGALGETCFIDNAGFENARVVRGRYAPPSDLSQHENSNPFFYPTFGVGVGHVYQAAPYISPDMHVWVISNSTVVPMTAGTAQALVHFEISVESLRRALARERGHHLLVVDRLTGGIVVDSERPQLGAHLLGHTDKRYLPLTRVTADHGLLTHDGLRMA